MISQNYRLFSPTHIHSHSCVTKILSVSCDVNVSPSFPWVQSRWCFRCRIHKCPSSTSPAASCVRRRKHPSGKPPQPCTSSDVDCIIITSPRLIAFSSIGGSEKVEEKLNWFLVDQQECCWCSQRRAAPPENFQFPCIDDSLRCSSAPSFFHSAERI